MPSKGKGKETKKAGAKGKGGVKKNTRKTLAEVMQLHGNSLRKTIETHAPQLLAIPVVADFVQEKQDPSKTYERARMMAKYRGNMHAAVSGALMTNGYLPARIPKVALKKLVGTMEKLVDLTAEE